MQQADPANPRDTDTAWLRRLAGRFIVFEGPDGSGKSTQLRRLSVACRAAGLKVAEARDPGGTIVAEKIRELLLSTHDEPICATAEMLLFMASRAQLVDRLIRPAMDTGSVVISDRFVSSTLAYQGTAGGVHARDIREVARIACSGIEPDLVVIFDVDEQTAAQRLSPLLDRMEAKGAAFHRRVREGYLSQAQEAPEKHLVIDATSSADDVWDKFSSALRDRAGAWS